MGVNALSKKLRPSGVTPDSLAKSTMLNGKTLGLDVFVTLHKALATVDGAGENLVQPAIPNSVVEQRCNRLCSYAKANNIKYAVAVDGKYHPMKAAENDAREADRNNAQSELDALFRTDDINSILASDEEKLKNALKLMKRSVRVTPDVIAAAVRIFRDNGHEVFGAPFEADWQLVYWELTGFTDGTISIDSDIWAMGSKVFVDCTQQLKLRILALSMVLR
ncbi:hypothetical protein ACHAWT_009485, partial [Skeletonema menzelii]